jgi:N12 class adenine-specific DNA methylase/adenine-specific DNA methylase
LSRATSLADLYRASVQEYTKTPAEWKGLLSCVARFYKRSFDNAVLIYAQKPDATQLGTFDEWHDKRVGRSINRGAKSIAVIDMVNPNASIKYLFDFMDTNGSVQSYRNLQKFLWELEEQYRPSVMMRFHEKYNTPTRSVDACLYHLVSRRVRDWILPYMENFRVKDEESPLHGMPEDAVKVEFMELVMESAAYTVFSKCGISTEMFEDESFENISNYNSLQLFMALGSCTVSIARPILNEIYREIQDIKIERSKIYENRAVDELHIQTGRGRDDVSRSHSIREPADRPDAGGTVREPVESVHDGEVSPQVVGTGGTGQDQRNDPSGRPGGRAEERGADPGTAGLPPHAGDGGHHGESRTYEHDNERSGRDRDGRSGAESQITPVSPPSLQNTKSSADGSRPSAGDFFAVPPKSQETMQVSRTGMGEEPQEEAAAAEGAAETPDHSSDLLETSTEYVAEEAYSFREEMETPKKPDNKQLSFFDMGMESGYEDNTGSGRDALLDADKVPEQTEALLEAKQIMQANEAHDRAILEDFDRRGLYGLNYHYSEEHHLYDGGPKTKFQNNVAAIRLLKELEKQGRKATAEEQVVLAKYVGWGGLANALTPGKSGWEPQYEEIRQLLVEEEFQAAQESTLTAYYTEQGVIRHIYDALEKFGFHGGNILDPAMATGNFFSVLPDTMADSRLYGVEIEPISGHIAKHLYPGADIQVTGFEHTSHPDQFFDVVIGNIPFNSIKVDDPRYNRYNFRIHDYFLAKSLDKTRPGGIAAVITSKYTMDKANSGSRRYLAQRAELLGAIRLPNNAFKQVAGTEATTDILFLKKREREIVPDETNSPWLSVEQNAEGIPMNTWFIDHPEMVLGKMVFDESVYGNEKSTACHPIPGDNLDEQLERAVSCLKGKYEEPGQEEDVPGMEKPSEERFLPADPSVRNFSYTLVEGKLYYREHSRMYEQDIRGKKAERIKGLLEITQAVRGLIDFQNQERGSLSGAEYEAALQEHIRNLNQIYDRFVGEYGYINAYANVIAFSRDASAPLLRSVEREKKDEKGVFEKTAMFYRATIHPKTMPTVVESAEEALKVSLNVKGRLDLDYMAQLYRKPDGREATKDEIIEELGEQIYQDPVLYAGDPYAGWQTAGEYLSGYVKDKLAEAVLKAEEDPERFSRNVEALRTVQPAPLTPREISFSLGTPWIPLNIYQEFMYEVFKTREGSKTGRYVTELEFSRYSGAYFIANKGNEDDSVTATQVYGTERMNAYEILEASLNLRFVDVKDRVEYSDPDTGEEKVKYVLNKKETILAREKQAQIKMEFERWLFVEPERAAGLTKLYNDRFNNIRPRTYDGSGLVLPDLSGDIRLRPHQLDVIAHGLYGDGNLLMAHEVGAGKTYAAIVLAHELKRLGKVSKPLITVPNHLVGQWSDAYMELYPGANILVAEKKDFQRANRRRFVSRIATGEYDCIIMAHSSFELIGLSRERQLSAMRVELDEVTKAIDEQKSCSRKDWTLKQMQIFRKNLQFRFDQLFNAEKKDNMINFEELGVDALIVDEAHAYKNNFSYTKMRNVAGVSSQSSQRAMDMHQKCQYINEIGGGKGVIYLTGTPVSNSMAELYVMQKTLQPQELERRGLLMFDAWAGTFGRVTSSLEIRPEGNGYQMKNRFSQFHNLPELMSMFSMIADIRTADMLELPTPELKSGSSQVIRSVCTPDQKRIVMELAERAEAIRNGDVDSSQDNFLKLTHEARLLSIDPRAIDPEIPDDPNTKLNLCAGKVAGIYQETAGDRLTQLIFCDQGTPKYDGSFNFYEATKAALLAQGVKAEEIAFIHDAKTDVQREQLFEKVRKGEIRILMGSTEKMGTGMNVQEKLTALHHLDVPWRPADLTQRNGRILRQGNENKEVSIFNYITENTFDSYLWQILEQKQRYISQIMTGRSPLRTCEDLDETVLQYAEFKALATSDPRVKEKMETDNEINRLTVLKSSWQTQQTRLQEQINCRYPAWIARKENEIAFREEDIRTYQANKTEDFRMMIEGRIYEERTKAADHLMVCACRVMKMKADSALDVGNYAGFTVRLKKSDLGLMTIQLCGKKSYSTDYGDSGMGNITRIEHLADHIVSDDQYDREELDNVRQQLAAAKEQCGKPFPDEERLLELQKKKVQLDLALEFKEDGEDVMAAEEDGEGNEPGKRKEPPTLEQRLYRKLCLFAAPILDGEAYYMKLQAKGYEDLVLEALGEEEYSIAHYYDQNGDSMRDPEITFTINRESRSIHPTSFLQDDRGVYYETADVTAGRVKDLNCFILQWFTNIKNQGFEPVKIKRYEAEEENGMER